LDGESSVAVRRGGQDIIAIRGDADTPPGIDTANREACQRSREREMLAPAFQKPMERDERGGDRFLNELVPPFRMMFAEGSSRMALNQREQIKELVCAQFIRNGNAQHETHSFPPPTTSHW
jgi:hypothetical protein